MKDRMNTKNKILIVDDSEMNRSILMDILEDEFDIIEAENGAVAVKILEKEITNISLMLLDIVMPEMDGFEVLAMMNKYHWIEEVPVVMISAETSSSYIERAYELGVTDFISRPFDSSVVYRRVNNTIMLYAKQKKLIGMVAEQIYEKEKQSALMIVILSHIVEFRNGESGLHVLHVQTLTELLLKCLVKKNNQYNLTSNQINLISITSALHDIGKIGISDHILNKPGRLTDEEFEIMKTHTTLGASMLKKVPFYQDEELIKIATEICLYHHEKYDGKGYPEGLKGDEIPISAQVVSLADVYDALTSERVYKKAFSHEKAMSMILNGECGAFNPILLECLQEIENEIEKELSIKSLGHKTNRDIRNITETIHEHEELSASERTLDLLEYERNKYEFFAKMSKEIQFEYTNEPPILTVSDWGAKKLGIEERTLNPIEDEKIIQCFGQETLKKLYSYLEKTSPKEPLLQFDFKLKIENEERWYRVIVQTIWSLEDTSKYLKFYGKLTDVHEEHVRLSDLKRISSHDPLTGLLNRTVSQKEIMSKMDANPEGHFALIMFDVDDFKSANDVYGHIFGDCVLKHVATQLQNSIRGNDIAVRIGGDEFLLFLEYKSTLEPIVDRIFHALMGEYGDFQVSISMGVAKSDDLGTDFATLFHCADCALYSAKKNGKGRYHFYEESMKNMLSAISKQD